MVSVGDARLTLAAKLKYFVTTILPLYIIESITITILQVSILLCIGPLLRIRTSDYYIYTLL